ncbi:VQ motif-containing protein 10-like [Gastrolobium bilobum]|uniref:VQ motif-containing protein 10-like n=1 Tax=Gastrolobium bilobum TaxID=150636 RepID=UPI002AAF83A1|nr:VQ motif-containing protein 10-like [Gastrolobium bilobum]
MTSGCCSEGPKIVHIETRYVETDAINFRNVVQCLTGKNSSMSWVGNGSSGSPFAEGSDNKGGTSHDGFSAKPEYDVTTDGKKNSLISSMSLKNMTFKDFDGFLSDLASMEELLWL